MNLDLPLVRVPVKLFQTERLIAAARLCLGIKPRCFTANEYEFQTPRQLRIKEGGFLGSR